MGTLRIEALDDALVIHFQSGRERINAYTLASTLVAVADAAKAANASLNSGHDVEVVVEAIGPGSFRAKVRALYSKSRNLFSDQNVRPIVLSLIAAGIFQRSCVPNENVNLEVHTDEVIVLHGNDRIIIPRDVYDATQVAERNSEFSRAVTRAIQAVAEDDEISGLSFVADMKSAPPEVVITKQELQSLAITDFEDPLSRLIEESADLQIIKAILEKSRRKWEFAWRGFRISAPISDDRFYAQFAAHRITIAPGDILKVKLRIKQSRDADTGIYTNHSYEVVEVFEHVPGMRQMHLNGE